jgi:hypothetical protein
MRACAPAREDARIRRVAHADQIKCPDSSPTQRQTEFFEDPLENNGHPGMSAFKGITDVNRGLERRPPLTLGV